MYARADITISGCVQGVGYRYYAMQQARRLSLVGTVKNQFDGTVRMVVEGEKAMILELIKRLRIGPRFANVRDVIVDYSDYQNEFNDFSII
ncbi:acylphosphatase [candidate division KSB1 bacterium]|nr:acylphosphatase [candidate division KSB1 bacterium]RQW01710.1 MAG: acylphosphatase [candidate division KSB1 bacterium]